MHTKRFRPNLVRRGVRALIHCALGFSFAAVAIAAQLVLWSKVPPAPPFMLVYPAVVLAAWTGGWAAGLTVIIVGSLGATYFFLPPMQSFTISSLQDVLDVSVFCAVSTVLTGLVVRAKAALQEARVARKAAEAATEAKDTVLAVVAHDLRNPLQTIGMSAELLLPEVAGQGRVATQLTRISRAAERAKRLVDNVLDSARIQAVPFPVEMTEAVLADVIDESLSPFKSLAESRSIQLDVPCKDAVTGRIRCDRDRVVQVLSNLVGNALKYTSPGGSITVSVTREIDGVRFDVTDTGCGMTDDELSHAFERLWHGKNPGHGTGLGLWIAKSLVEGHGGRIEAASKPGEGTRVSFVLPQLSVEPPPTEPASLDDEDPPAPVAKGPSSPQLLNMNPS